MGMKLSAKARANLLSHPGVTIHGSKPVATYTPPIREQACYTLYALPITANLIWRISGNRLVKSKAYKDWLEAASVELRKYLIVRVPSPVKVTITLAGKVNAQRDLDNFAKPLIDLMRTVGVIENDSLNHVCRIELEYLPSEETPRVNLLIERL